MALWLSVDELELVEREPVVGIRIRVKRALALVAVLSLEAFEHTDAEDGL